MNDDDRKEWVNNDEGLYDWWRTTRPRMSLTAFVRANRAELDAAINPVLAGDKPAHFLKYGG